MSLGGLPRDEEYNIAAHWPRLTEAANNGHVSGLIFYFLADSSWGILS
jgi:hypothetical protein